MPTNALQIHKEDKKFFKYDHGENSMKELFIICANFAYLPDKKITCHNTPRNLSTT